jgi:hypothetical protein
MYSTHSTHHFLKQRCTKMSLDEATDVGVTLFAQKFLRDLWYKDLRETVEGVRSKRHHDDDGATDIKFSQFTL